MTRQYSPKTFLRQSPNPVLQQYFHANNLALDVDWKCLTPRRIDPLFDAIEALPDEARESVERDFRLVFGMATPKGRLLFIEQGEIRSIDLAERLSHVENHYEAAMVIFLEHREVFEVASCVNEMHLLGHWRKRWVGKGLHATTEPEQIAAFEDAMQGIYKKQGRGRHCHVDRYERRDPLRFCYFAYPEDFPTSDIEYDDQHNFGRVTRHPAMENAFVYDPQAGVVEISATGPKKHKEALAEAFCVHILGLKTLPPENGLPRITLEPAMNPSFSFPIEPEDGVVRMEFKTIRLDYPCAEQMQLTVKIKPNGTPNAIHALMRDKLGLMRNTLRPLYPSQAKIVVEFEPANGRRGKRMTFQVTSPDSCGLGDDPHEQIARRILKRAGITND